MANPSGSWDLFTPAGKTGLFINYLDAQNNFDGWIGVKPNETQIRGNWKPDPVQPNTGTVTFYTYPLYPDTTLPGEAYVTNLYVDGVVMSGLFSAAILDQIIDIVLHRPIPPAQGWTAVWTAPVIG